LDCGLGATLRIKKTAVNSTLSGNNITLNANNNINAAGVDIQADNSISGTAKDINIPGLLSDWLAGLLSACLSFECL
jgi:hypothetical protein